ncbi:unnamed protein product [Medioppia subpectinata]|uniref:Cytochrome P450 n=1 Tax=Medioppia subpectinata TaxID=1979941 RepID=A0A7R9PXK8_9ACAR|nr:unnamed protein product [Medioppia subpectinata]CAG2104911.1 unnamed protein product [Medioppia subpectinata]
MKTRYMITEFLTDQGSSIFLYEFVPVLQYFMADPLAKYKQYFNDLMTYTRDIYQTHDKTHDSENLRDFCDILIAAKHEAIADDKQTAPYLTDDNLPAALIDLLAGGTETSQTSFLWAVLFIAYYPDYQDKLRNEINNELGDCMPVIEDKSKLNYTMAFISEILRYKNPIPIGVPHKMLDDSQLEVSKLSKVYGPVFTLWIGPLPFVFICDPDMGRQAFTKCEFSGQIFNNESHSDVVFNDSGKCWKSLRRVSLTAIRKYAKSKALSEVVDENVRQMIDNIAKDVAINTPFKSKSYAYNMFVNIMGSVVFSKKINNDQAVLTKTRYMITEFLTDLGPSLFLYQFVPAIADDKQTAPYLTDDNLPASLIDMLTEVSKLSKVYGPVFTLWIGPLPFVFICDLDMGRQAFTKCEFSGQIFNNESHSDVVFNDSGKCWESLRRVSLTAIRKYAKSKALSEVVDENVRQMIDNITKDVAINTPFKPKPYAYNMFVNIMGSVVFSKKINNDQAVLTKARYMITEFLTDLGPSLFLYQFVPVLQYFMADPLAKYKQYFNDLMTYTRNIYQTHDKTHDSENLRDFCDILIAAKHEAIADDKQTAPYLTDDNLPAALIDMLIAGSETTQTSFLWTLLFIAYYPDYQDRLRDEINNELGDCMPVIEDKSKLNYTMAFISEILRYKNATPIGVPHKMLDDSKLEVSKLSKVYGLVFTLWIGPLPFVIICDLDMGRQAFNKCEFAGRIDMLFGEIYNNERHADIAFNDYGKCWESLHRVSLSAIRKYAKSKALSEVVDENVRQMIDNITRDVAINTPFKPKLYAYNMFVNIMGDAMFSKKINDDQDVQMKIKYTITDFHTDLGASLFLYQFVPVLRYLMANPMAKYRQYFNDLMNYTRDIYQTHDKTHDNENLPGLMGAPTPPTPPTPPGKPPNCPGKPPN